MGRGPAGDATRPAAGGKDAEGRAILPAPGRAALPAAGGARPRVIVVGSVNVDLVALVARLPAPGETVTGGTFARHHGGKGGNQAVAAARLGASVAFVGAVGDDAFGTDARAALEADEIDCAELATLSGLATGVALILVDATGENAIAVASGANAAVTPASVSASLERLCPGPSDVVLVGAEIPVPAVAAALAAGRAAGALTVLNPAPATGIGASLLASADIVTPNRTEVRQLADAAAARTGHAWASADTEERGRALLEAGAEGPGVGRAVVVTLGPGGSLVLERASGGAVVATDVAPQHVDAVDSTGAGDTFSGALAAALAEGRGVVEGARWAGAAAALATTSVGAREGMPTRAALDAFLAGRGG
jgi:ribokinase